MAYLHHKYLPPPSASPRASPAPPFPPPPPSPKFPRNFPDPTRPTSTVASLSSKLTPTLIVSDAFSNFRKFRPRPLPPFEPSEPRRLPLPLPLPLYPSPPPPFPPPCSSLSWSTYRDNIKQHHRGATHGSLAKYDMIVGVRRAAWDVLLCK